MSRAAILKREIQTDARALGYAGKPAWEIARLMNEVRSKALPEFATVTTDQREVIAQKIRDLTDIQFNAIKTYLRDTARIVTAGDLADKSVEVKVRRADEIGMDTIGQGDIEMALK